ncbi:MAG: hypothetical protein K6U14_11230 [Firmicutes bacterium]|nr:anti-sigma factor domain-containing protein [Alicyclobacillaceae bacterium]MCL6498185.1 hypothetical protein [Bacillota bacterium]
MSGADHRSLRPPTENSPRSGVVLSLAQGRAVLLLPGGEFREVRAEADWQVGQTVAWPAVGGRRRWALWAGAAAVVVGLAVSLPRWANGGVAQAATVVSVDFDGAGINLTLDAHGRVLAATAYGAAAEGYLKVHPVVGKAAPTVLRGLTATAIRAGWVSPQNPYLVLGSTQGGGWLQRLAQSEATWRREYGWPVAVVTVAGPLPQILERTAPQHLPVTVGRYLLWARRHPGRMPTSWDQLQGEALPHLVPRTERAKVQRPAAATPRPEAGPRGQAASTPAATTKGPPAVDGQGRRHLGVGTGGLRGFEVQARKNQHSEAAPPQGHIRFRYNKGVSARSEGKGGGEADGGER